MRGKGLAVRRLFTKPGVSADSMFSYDRRDSVIKNPDGRIVFEIKGVEVPSQWSQLATDILAQKYIRKAGVPQVDANGKPKLDRDGKQRFGPETSVRQVVKRLVGCWRHWGEEHGYFSSKEDAEAFEEELAYLHLNQMVAPNSPQWFNTGLAWAYKIMGSPQGHYYADAESGEIKQSEDAYTRPQPHACFIQSVRDDLVNPGGIFDLVVREARIFKYGSGTGSNFSALRGRGEPLSGGGTSSGLMSFLKVFDAGAGAIKSGGTTRRAAKMVCLDMDHPEIETFIMLKYREEQKVADLVSGSKVCKMFLQRIADSAKKSGSDWKKNGELRATIRDAKRLGVPMNYILRVLQLADQGAYDVDFREYDTHYESDAYQTVTGQNANNSVRVPNAFLDAVEHDKSWDLLKRTDGQVWRTLQARELWQKICLAAWHSADPGLQYDSTINEWHTCPADGKIKASNPCVTGDTKVLTEEGRWLRIDAMLHEPRTILANTGRIMPVDIDGSFKTGRKPVYQLTTKAGYELKLTADHKVFTVNRGFIPACELTKDDHLLLPGEPVAPLQDSADAVFYQMLGVYLGDGCGSPDPQRGIQLTMNKETERPVLTTFAEYVSTYERTTHRQSPATVQLTATSAKFTITNSRVISRFAQFLDLSLLSHEKRLSDALFALPLSAQKCLLQGLFTADGTVADYGEKSQYVALDSTSSQLLKDVQLLLLGFGIKSKLYTNRRAGKEVALLPDGKGGLREYPVREMHSLRLSRTSRLRFEELIGFMTQSPKNAHLRALNARVSCYDERPTDTVETLEYLGEEDVYDLTEPLTASFVANGLTVHNCSEYMFLDDTACNLASLNVVKFLDEKGELDVAAFTHATRLMTIVLEISVLMAQFPSAEMARLSYKFRSLGLGYANVGSALMRRGVPYDSDEARAFIGGVSALMTGVSYAVSAEMAAAHGPFDGYAKNKEHMLRVIRNHRRAAYDAEKSEYEGLTVTPVGIDPKHCPPALLASARKAWDDALANGEQHGYRNAQVTVIAPTGTIGLLMDCDTTGIEPDFALVKFKKLAGGGYFKIINQGVPAALAKLGYTPTQIDAIIKHAVGHGTLQGAKAVTHEQLLEKGFTKELLAAAEKQLPSAFDIQFVFNRHTLGDEAMRTLGFEKERYEDAGFNLLQGLGFSKEEIEAANEHVCGTMTLEGAPGLKGEHLPVFDCASKCGRKGRRYLSYQSHIKAMAAAQPFISGAISKTVNMPNHATIAEISDAYLSSWKLMLKANALYRDGSKLSQPLNTISEDLSAFDEDDVDEASVTPEAVQRGIAARHAGTPEWEGVARSGTIVDKNVRVVTREYEDGSLGTVSMTLDGETPEYQGLLAAYSDLVSFAVQHGIPLSELVDSFTFTDFPPGGPVYEDIAIKNATSPVDYLFRVLGHEYLGRQDLVHLKDVKPLRNERSTTSTGSSSSVKREKISEQERKVLEARAKGYTGDKCPGCGSLRLKRNGTCALCEDCGATTGCS